MAKDQNTEIHNPYDKIFKLSMVDLRVAKSMVKNYLPSKLSKHFILDTLQLCNSSFIDQKYKHTQSDLLYSIDTINGNKGYVYLLWEHQSVFDKNMPLRILNYTCRIMEQHVNQGHKFLPLVVPILVYHGNTSPYPGSTDLLDAFADKELAQEFLFKPFHLLDLTVIKDKKLVQDIWTALPNMLLKHLRDTDLLTIMSKLKEPIIALYAEGGEKFVDVTLECLLRYRQPENDKELLEAAYAISQRTGMP